MALSRWELTPQAQPGSWGQEGREVVGTRAGPCASPVQGRSRKGSQIGGHTGNTPKTASPQCSWLLPTGCPCPETTKEAGSAVASFWGPPNLPFGKFSKHASCPLKFPTYLFPAKAHQGYCIPCRHHLGKRCPGAGQPMPMAGVSTPSQALPWAVELV